MVTNVKKFTCAAVLVTACSFTIWIASTRAKEESVLVNKPAVSSADATTGPILPPPQNPNEQVSGGNHDDELPPPSNVVPRPKQLPIPPQSSPPSSPVTKQSFMRPAEPRSPGKGKLVGEEPMPVPPIATPSTLQTLPPPSEEAMPPSSPLPSGIQVKPTPQIDYDTHHDARRMLRFGQINIVVLTKDPAEGCYYQIPLTVPACCVGEPSVSAGRGLLGRGLVAYEWPCGFKAKIKFRHIIGDVKVDYEAD
jgi:hypothetical protein